MRKLLFIMTIVHLFLTGCGSASKENTPADVVKGESSRQVEAKTPIKGSITTQAIYIGLIDSHSIEVLLNNQPIAIQINEEQRKVLEPLHTNAKIYIEYYVKEETMQIILEEVEIK